MPARSFISKELASLFGVLANPHRIRIIEELRNSEQDVNTLQSVLGISHSRASQHLAVLRMHKLVAERRQGRHVFYHITNERLPAWILDGLDFIQPDLGKIADMQSAVEQVRAIWGSNDGSESDSEFSD